ncbi:MAG: hypothetical protein LBF59_08365 [Prevotellaceae bacterium]|nr:hypothetical protein [Prevotellaceae bacterium]
MKAQNWAQNWRRKILRLYESTTPLTTTALSSVETQYFASPLRLHRVSTNLEFRDFGFVFYFAVLPIQRQVKVANVCNNEYYR